jgi:excisionase family DNA binding protein
MQELWTTDQVAEYLQVKPLTVTRYMQQGKLREGAHWVKIGDRVIRFNADLVKHWAACGECDPALHEAAIEHHIRQLKQTAGKRK